MHIATSNTQYGYKSNLSAIDAIGVTESYMGKPTDATNLLLMDLSRAFDTINRTIPWATWYKNGLPVEMILHIRRWHQNALLMTKTQGQYGPQVNSNIGVYQGSAISVLLFTIYLGDMMEDYAALNLQNPIPMRHTQDCAPETQENNLHEYIKNQYAKMDKKRRKWKRNTTRKS